MHKVAQMKNYITIALLAVMLSACTAVTGRETAGEYIDDATITTKVKTAIFNDPSLRANEISVETFKGEVQLSGFVADHNIAVKAEKHAREVSGVRTVKNNIIVKSKTARKWN